MAITLSWKTPVSFSFGKLFVGPLKNRALVESEPNSAVQRQKCTKVYTYDPGARAGPGLGVRPSSGTPCTRISPGRNLITLKAIVRLRSVVRNSFGINPRACLLYANRPRLRGIDYAARPGGGRRRMTARFTTRPRRGSVLPQHTFTNFVRPGFSTATPRRPETLKTRRKRDEPLLPVTDRTRRFRRGRERGRAVNRRSPRSRRCSTGRRCGK